jgi:hypothetical protein
MKGYTYAQETQRQIGLEAVKGGIVKEGGSGSGLGEVASLGLTLGAVGGVINLTKDALGPINNNSLGIGQAVGGMMTQGWSCSCGETNITGKFCSNCGAKQVTPNEKWECACGSTVNKNFCAECGAKKPVSWNCVCGNSGIMGKFCSECGAKRITEGDAANDA